MATTYKYLLSDGTVTGKLEKYILDLIKINLTLMPSDIPGSSRIGFNFSIAGTYKDQLEQEITSKVESLIDKIKERLNSKVTIKIVSLSIISETQAKLVIQANDITSDEINIDLYEN